MLPIQIHLVDGKSSALQSTLAHLSALIKWENNTHVGRSKAGFDAVLRSLRLGADIPSEFEEDQIILCQPENTIVRVNVGGTVFWARKEVLITMDYFSAALDWGQEASFIDQDPADFAALLKAVEARFHGRAPPAPFDPLLAGFFGFGVQGQVKPISNQSPALADVSSEDAILALCTYGAQNVYFHQDDLQLSQFYKKMQKRPAHSFAFCTQLMEKGDKKEKDEYSVVFAGKHDLIGNAYIAIDLVEDKQFDVDLIKRITFSFGDHIIDSYSSNTIRILSNVERSENRVVFDCAFFWQNRPDLYVPLSALDKSEVRLRVSVTDPTAIARMAVQYKAIYLERQEREFFKMQFLEYRIVETWEKEFRVIAQDASFHRLKLTSLLHPVQDMFVVIKPAGDMAKDSEPLAKLRVLMKREYSLEFDPVMTRRIIPREKYGIHDNQELIYYLPLDYTINASRLDYFGIGLSFAVEGTFDVVVVVRVGNILRYQQGYGGKAFASN